MRLQNNLVVVVAITAISILFSPHLAAQSLSISTLAGSTSGGGYIDDVGLNARFSLPSDVAVDVSGTIYVADTGNHVIRRITTDGHVTTIAGKPGEVGTADGVGSSARFNLPFGVTVGLNNVLYVADTYNHTIRTITPAGVVSTLAGLAGTSGTADASGSSARFTFPGGIAADTAGNLYVADINNHAIRKIAPGSLVTTLAGTKRTSGSADGFGTQALFRYPYGLAVDATGFVYVADTENHLIRKISPEGRVTTIAGAPPNDEDSPGSKDGTGNEARFYYPWSVAVDASGNMFVTDTSNRTIRKITAAAAVTTVAGTARSSGNADGTGVFARFHEPSGIAIDSGGNLLISDRYNHAIRRMSSTAVVSTVAGSVPARGLTNGQGTNARFLFPEGVAFDSDGNVFVADLSHSIRKIAAGGTVTTFAGSPGSSGSADGIGPVARFLSPQSLTVDPNGYIFVADTGNHVIRKITPAGAVTTFAGLAGTAGDSNGSGTQGRFDTPIGVAADRLGNVYVADTYNHRIKLIEPAGLVSTFAGSGSSGSRDGVGVSATFYYPTGLALDDARNIYVADWGNHTIRKITQAGVVTTLAGSAGTSGSANGTGTAARFDFPYALAARSDGTLFVADTDNNTIRRVSPAGVVTSVAGLVRSAGNVNGSGANARFFFPDGIAVDGMGRVVVADTYNHSIRLGTFAPPQVISFTASPNAFSKPQPVTLSWSTSDATTATIDNGVGVVPLSGTRTVTPTGTTTYSLAVTGEGGSGSAKVTVFIRPQRRRAVHH